MHSSNTSRLVKQAVDPDLAKQAIPGHGVPSQDPDPAAQFRLSPEEAEREIKTVFMGGGLVAAAAIGAGVGVCLMGPVGVVFGGTIGSIAGALAAAVAGSILQRQRWTLSS